MIEKWGLILTAISVILNSLSFWFHNADMIAETGNKLMVSFATYPDEIFKGLTKMLLFTLIPVGIANYLPIKIITEFNLYFFLINTGICIILIWLAFIIFYQRIKHYSSSNLMNARIWKIIYHWKTKLASILKRVFNIVTKHLFCMMIQLLF